jgi:hypothetical protein
MVHSLIDLIVEVPQHEIRGVADRFRHRATLLLLVLKARQSAQVQGQLTPGSSFCVLWSDASFRLIPCDRAAKSLWTQEAGCCRLAVPTSTPSLSASREDIQKAGVAGIFPSVENRRILQLGFFYS